MRPPMDPDRGALVRRAVHLASPLLLVYYLLPDDLGIGFPKVFLATLLWVGALAVEVTRHATGLDIVGLRSYEQHQISAYFWGATGLLIGLLLFPAPFVVVGTLGMAWVDPLCGWTRERGGYPLVPLLVYAVLAVVTLLTLTERGLGAVALLAGVAAGVAVAVEYPTLPYLDDDFTTLVAGAGVLTLLGGLL